MCIEVVEEKTANIGKDVAFRTNNLPRFSLSVSVSYKGFVCPLPRRLPAVAMRRARHHRANRTFRSAASWLAALSRISRFFLSSSSRWAVARDSSRAPARSRSRHRHLSWLSASRRSQSDSSRCRPSRADSVSRSCGQTERQSGARREAVGGSRGKENV